MRRNERGEIATILTLSTLAVIAVTAVVSSFFVNQNRTTSSKASETCEYYDLDECEEDDTCQTCTTSNCTDGMAKCLRRVSSSSTTSTGGSCTGCLVGGTCYALNQTVPPNTYCCAGGKGETSSGNCPTYAHLSTEAGCPSCTGGGTSSTAGCTKHNCSEVKAGYEGNYWVKSGRYYADDKCTQDKTDFGIGNWCKTLQDDETPGGLPYCINAGYGTEQLCEQVYGDGQCRECIYGTITHKWEFFGSASGYPTCNSYKWATKGSCEDNCKTDGKACYLCNNNNAPWFHCDDSGDMTCDISQGYEVCGTNCCEPNQHCTAAKSCEDDCNATSKTNCIASDCTASGKVLKPGNPGYYRSTNGIYYGSANCQGQSTKLAICCQDPPDEDECANQTQRHCSAYECSDDDEEPSNNNPYFLISSRYYDSNCALKTEAQMDTHCGCNPPRGSCVDQPQLICNEDYQCSNVAEDPITGELFYNVGGTYYTGASCTLRTRSFMDTHCGCGEEPDDTVGTGDTCTTSVAGTTIPRDGHRHCVDDDTLGICEEGQPAARQVECGSKKCVAGAGTGSPDAGCVTPRDFSITVTILGNPENIDEVTLNFGPTAGSYGTRVTQTGVNGSTLTLSGTYSNDVTESSHCQVRALLNSRIIDSGEDFLCIGGAHSSQTLDAGGAAPGVEGGGELGVSACYARDDTRVNCSVEPSDANAKTTSCTTDYGWTGNYTYTAICSGEEYGYLCSYKCKLNSGGWSYTPCSGNVNYDVNELNATEYCDTSAGQDFVASVTVKNLSVFTNYDIRVRSLQLCLDGDCRNQELPSSPYGEGDVIRRETFRVNSTESHNNVTAVLTDSNNNTYTDEADVNIQENRQFPSGGIGLTITVR